MIEGHEHDRTIHRAYKRKRTIPNHVVRKRQRNMKSIYCDVCGRHLDVRLTMECSRGHHQCGYCYTRRGREMFARTKNANNPQVMVELQKCFICKIPLDDHQISKDLDGIIMRMIAGGMADRYNVTHVKTREKFISHLLKKMRHINPACFFETHELDLMNDQAYLDHRITIDKAFETRDEVHRLAKKSFFACCSATELDAIHLLHTLYYPEEHPAFVSDLDDCEFFEDAFEGEIIDLTLLHSVA